MKNTDFDDLLKRYISMTEKQIMETYQNKTMLISHLLHNILISTSDNDVIACVVDYGIDLYLLIDAIDSCIKENERNQYSGDTISLHTDYRKVLESASKSPMQGKVSILDIFIASVKEKNELTPHYKALGVDHKGILATAKELLSYDINDRLTSQQANVKSNIVVMKNAPDTNISAYCDDMIKMAKDGKFQACIGRDKERELVYRILSRQRKGNVILIGKEGVGKTQIIEGIAKDIADGLCPSNLLDIQLLNLNLNSLVAGTRYRGDFEERLKDVFNSIVNSKNVVLFIDEIHSIIGAGSSEGGMDMSNILKPYLTKSDFRIIGATTDDEFRRTIEKNKAFKRRFQEIMVDAPNDADCLNILMNVKSPIEEKFHVKFTQSVLEYCIQSSNKYLPYRTQPDKSIDILQDTAISVRMKSSISTELSSLLSIKNDIHLDKLQMVETGDYEWAYHIINLENETNEKIVKEKNRIQELSSKEIIISNEDIDKMVEEMVKIPVSSKLNVKKLKADLVDNIIGQEYAINNIVQKLLLNNINLKNKNKPIASFLFVGGTGIGKTETAKIISKNLYGGKMLRIDCSEIGSSHDISKLIGTSAGYVGYEDGGILTKHIKYNPFSLVLFDEIEKAGDKLFDLLLQILDEGRVTDNTGDVLDMKNCIIILTSNVGSKEFLEYKNSLGFVKPSNEHNHSIVESSIRKKFKPEFINRIDKIIHFEALSKESLTILLNKIIKDIRIGINQYGIEFRVKDETFKTIIDKTFDSGYGYRELERLSEEMITIPLLEYISMGESGSKEV